MLEILLDIVDRLVVASGARDLSEKEDFVTGNPALLHSPTDTSLTHH